VDPLLALGALAADIEQLEVEVLEGEVDLDDAGRLDARAQDVLLRRLVVLGAQPVQVVEEIFGGVVELGGDFMSQCRS
jgi:hypothetical protein